MSGALVACGGRGAQARPKAFDETMHTITSKADMCLATAHLTAYYSRNGEGDQGQPVTEPLRTIPTVDRFGPVITTCATSLTDAQLARARQVHAFLAEFLGDALTPYSQDGLVVLQVQGEWYVLADIGMRMLTPRELARCQGFPENYVLEHTAEGTPISKARQVRGIGNSVCPQLAEVLTRAQLSAAMAEAAD
ncbi:DNA cytosine methyltransferase [Deinococcus multiflagellatus]|uniref:DNA cytosine methyltransferase n=1 Tax=Deinococcus multiflagellatus TaxID=1656887 RepID=A0ABW1ZEW4_9DEIO